MRFTNVINKNRNFQFVVVEIALRQGCGGHSTGLQRGIRCHQKVTQSTGPQAAAAKTVCNDGEYNGNSTAKTADQKETEVRRTMLRYHTIMDDDNRLVEHI